ncbi:MAG: hypothetical protein CML22_07090 [Rheinheimera sp.]|nr:hypothetical protein [Rheinheimera sp.]MBM34049.1 hypothetical protein [Rheinheimera sp.]|tara:strand:- start:68101 stop:68286 length:186 start_codon:yes stop_codon:yes gene_type:complete
MTENLALFEEATFTEFELATAEQIAMSLGRKVPNKGDMVMACEKSREWNQQRRELGLTDWV